MKIISIINQKGGVAKTTTVLNMYGALKLRGYRTLCIDLDPQCNLTQVLCPAGTQSTLADVLSGRIPADHAVSGDLIAGSANLSGMDALLKDVSQSEYLLLSALMPIRNDFDFILIDTPPALGSLTVNALMASDSIVIPAQADLFSHTGIAQLGATIRTIRPELKIAGILLCRYSSRTTISRDMAQLIGEQLAKPMNTKVFSSRIRECTALRESQACAQHIFDYAPKSNGAKDYSAFIDEFLTEVNHG